MLRLACARYSELQEPRARGRGWKCPASGASRPSASASIAADETFTHFEDKPSFAEVDVLANRYLEDYPPGELDRLDVAYTKFESVSRQYAVVETLLPLAALDGARRGRQPAARAAVRVPALGREHSGRGRADQLQGASCSSASSTRP